jgi:hypothetical protein
MDNNRIYSILYILTIPAVGQLTRDFNILSSTRRMGIRRITIDRHIYCTGTASYIPEAENESQKMQLQVGIAATLLSNPVFPTVVPSTNGGVLTLTGIRSYEFNDVFVTNALNFELTCTNLDALNEIINQIHIMVETVENLQ